MKKTTQKESKRGANPFSRMHRVFEKNILLQEVSIQIIGSYASRYDDSVLNEWKNIIDEKIKASEKNKKKTITFTVSELGKIEAVTKKHPQQSELFLKNTLVSIVSTLDTLTARLFEFYFTKNPSKLSIENQSLTFSELKNIVDIAQAEKYLVNREVELLLIQKGFKDRLKILKEVLDIGITNEKLRINALLKLVKIRNLIVHNEGKADADFIKMYGIEGMKIGDLIKVSKEYLLESLYLVYFIGSYLLQEAQLKYSSDSLKSEDYIINNVMHWFIKNNNYNYLGQIYAYSKERKLDQINEKMIVINYCIGLKKQGKDLDKIDFFLKKEDWSAVTLEFKMSLAVLREDDISFYSILEKMLKTKIIGQDELVDWEIFLFYKKRKRFKMLVKKYS